MEAPVKVWKYTLPAAVCESRRNARENPSTSLFLLLPLCFNVGEYGLPHEIEEDGCLSIQCRLKSGTLDSNYL